LNELTVKFKQDFNKFEVSENEISEKIKEEVALQKEISKKNK